MQQDNRLRRTDGAMGRRAARSVFVLALAAIVLVPTTASGDPTLFSTSTAVAHAVDDAEESAGGDVDLSSSDLELDGSQTVGLRFRDVHVPANATIVAAHVQFQTDEATSGTTSLFIEIEAADDSAGFETTSADISSRPRGAQSVSWEPAAWDTIGEAGPAQLTPNLAALVQGVTDRPGWSPGNAVTLIVTGSGSRVAEAFEGSPEGAPRLQIDYLAESSPQCSYWVDPSGDDLGDGTETSPWATIGRAVQAIPDAGCTVWVQAGTYPPLNIERRFATMVEIRAVSPYLAVIEGASTVFDIDGARNVTLDGFRLRHVGEGSIGYVAIVDRDNSSGLWAELIVLRNNIFHDSYDNDLLKVHSGVRDSIIENNVFYNQGPIEQHIDVNSVSDVVIQDNLFFNDFARSGRERPGTNKHYIVVKDSGGLDDGQLGSLGVTIRRNIFSDFQGGVEAYIAVGNDGKDYYEADDVLIESNLFVGNSTDEASAPLAVSGARNIRFLNNTVVGDLPSSSYGFRVDRKGANLVNENVVLSNNIWADPTGTMSDFSSGEPAEVVGLDLSTNLYWNAGAVIPEGSVGDAGTDPAPVMGDPLLQAVHANLVVPYWTGTAFLSGSTTIRAEFVRLAESYGAIPAGSPAVDRADPAVAASTDLLGRPRGASPDLGAYEADTEGAPVAADDAAGTDEDVAVVVPVLDNDVDPGGATLGLDSVSQPARGAAFDNGDGTITYVPDADVNGTDTFTYTATNGTLTSSPATVTITIAPVNDPPSAGDDTYQTSADAPVRTGNVLDNDTDVDGDALVVAGLDTSATLGTVTSVGDGTFDYSPPPGFTGEDSFAYRASDGTASSAPAVVTISVVPLPPDTEYLAQGESTGEGSVISGDLASTYSSDDDDEVLQERVTGGRRANRRSVLEHEWTFDLPGGSLHLVVEAHRTANTEGDDFVLELSTDGGSTWSPLVTITQTVDDDQPQTVPVAVPAGPAIVRARDTDRTQGNSSADSLFVDRLVFVGSGGAAPPVVTIAPTDGEAAEPGDPGEVTLSRSPASGPLTVDLSISGSATAGDDYLALPTSVSFVDGQESVAVAVQPVDDDDVEPTETVAVSVGSSADYLVGSPAIATVDILDDDDDGGGVAVDHLSDGETSARGAITGGDHTATHVSDDVYEELTEEHYAGRKRTRLEHVWSFDVAAGAGPLQFAIEAHHSGGESFSFDLSVDGSSWIRLLTVTETVDTGTEMSVDLDPALSGSFRVRVTDDDRSNADPGIDLLWVDRMVIRRG